MAVASFFYLLWVIYGPAPVAAIGRAEINPERSNKKRPDP